MADDISPRRGIADKIIVEVDLQHLEPVIRAMVAKAMADHGRRGTAGPR